MDGLEHGVDRFGLSLARAAGPWRPRRPEHGRLGLAAGPQHRGLPLAFRGQDGRLLGAFGGQDRGPLVPVGAHLLLHRVLDGAGRLDRLELDPADPHAPLPGRLVELLRSTPLMLSREVSVVSRSMPPTTFRSVVTVSCSTAVM